MKRLIMKRLIRYQAILICLLTALTLSTPAQTSDLPKRNSEKKASELPLVDGAASLGPATPNDGSDREGHPGADAKAEDAKGDQPPNRFAPVRQPLLALIAAADQQPQAAGQAQQATSQAAGANGAGANGNGEAKNGELLIAPYPISNPALGTGLQWVAGYIFKLNKEDKVSPASFFGTAGMYTNNGSWGVLLGGLFYLKQDRFRVTGAVADANINYDFYGIGKLAGVRGLFLPISVKGKGFLIQPLVRIAKNLYLGPRFQLRQLDTTINFSEIKPQNQPDNLPPDLAEEVSGLLSTRTVALGPHLQRDTRNDQFYPTKGTALNAGVDFFSKALGSKFDYQTYLVRFEGYRSLGERQVLAFGSLVCAATGDRIPIYDLCIYGTRNYIRGYSAGRFQDRRMWATQAEYRLRLPKLLGIGFTERFGVVGFGGFGWVGKQFRDMTVNDMLPGGGAGLRFRLTKKYPINFRVDYGVGRFGHTFSMGVGEAF